MEGAISQQTFIAEYSKAISQETTALFIGAGMSIPSGFGAWKKMLMPVANELQLDINRITDLVSLAQYGINKRNRKRLTDLVAAEFSKSVQTTENHDIIARLPIKSIWTTNFDTLIEQAFQDVRKKVDVKRNKDDLTIDRPGIDATIYKMHGDYNSPNDVVLTKDDYENYEKNRGPFLNKLRADLTSKTFLFLGFSFEDPNINYVLSHLQVVYGNNKRDHYCIMGRPSIEKDESTENFEHRRKLFGHKIEDLKKRYSINVVLVDTYEEVNTILETLSRESRKRNIFVSGSAASYPFGEEKLINFVRALGKRITSSNFNLVTGYGRGLSEPLILGALDGLYKNNHGNNKGRYIIEPFPDNRENRAFENHRKNLISQANAVLFICGNRLNDLTGEVEDSLGVREEFDITKNLKRFPIPIKAFGFESAKIWDEVSAKLEDYFPEPKKIKKAMRVLESDDLTEASLDQIMDAIFEIVEKISS